MNRIFHHVTGVALAMCALHSPEGWAEENVKPVDVVVVGGGLAGLSAAQELVGQGLSVIVLEASDRVGGRTWTKKVSDNAWVDMGGQWIGPAMKHILALAESVGVETFPSYHQGNDIFYFDGKRTEYSAATGFPIPEADLLEYQAIEKQLDELALQVPAENPGSSDFALEWDSQTVDTWIRDNVKTPGAKFLLRVFVLGYFAVEPREVSFLHFLFYIRAGGGLHQLHSDGVASRFIGGAQQVSEKVADGLGDRVRFHMPVRKISQTREGVVVLTDTDRFEAKYVIVAMAPPLAGRITYHPNLPANRDQFTQRAPMGSSIKIHAIYDTPFWREKGLSGRVISQEDDIALAVDNSPPNGQSGIIAGFLEGNEARRWSDKTKEELKTMVLDTFVKFYGPEAASIVGFEVANWDEETWARGCFTGVLPPGVWSGFPGVVREPVGRIHWAGTETAFEWYAYMDGAVSSGKRAAKEIIHAEANSLISPGI